MGRRRHTAPPLRDWLPRDIFFMCRSVFSAKPGARFNVQGWWVGRTVNDPYGHLLRVSPSYGRYLGQAYTPHDLAEVKVGALFEGGPPVARQQAHCANALLSLLAETAAASCAAHEKWRCRGWAHVCVAVVGGAPGR
jgi:hypothetical protein